MGKGKKHRTSSVETKKDINLMDYASKIKINYAWVFLLVFLVLGFYLRFYHIDYPVIGYHNWKTAHYATEARNFEKEGFFQEGFFVPMRDTMNGIDEPADGGHNDTFPSISIIVAILFKLFGESIRIARLAGIFFSLASVIVFYMLVKTLFKKESIALICAFLAAINPMFVFFSHNVEVINPGLFFMLLGAYLFVLWTDNTKKNIYLYLASFFVMMGIITKYTFIVIALPILFVFPYKKILKDWKKYLTPLLIASAIMSLFPAWFLYSEYYIRPKLFGAIIGDAPGEYSLANLVDFSIVFNKDFWNVMKLYVADNFTLLGMGMAFLGSIFFVMMFFRNKDKVGYKFMMGYFIVIFVFLIVMGFKLSGHNYHQFPIAPAVIFMMAYLIEVIAKNISNFATDTKARAAIYLLVAGIILFAPLSQGKSLYTNGKDSMDRMYNTQFPGFDIAGNYIREHSQPNERFFHSSGQSFGILWHAGIKGYKPPNNAEYFKRAEDEYNVSWVFVYQWGFANYFQNQEVADYLRNNYRLVQVALIPQGDGATPLYFLFRKGGSFNDSQVNQLIQGKPMFKQQYFYTTGPYEIVYINLE
ncbi:MAG: glycosyltransferase family 39 protein [archaeon]